MNEIKKLSDNEYFSSTGISNSSLILFDRSPKHFLKGLTPTLSMKEGTMCHKYILEHDTFFNDYFILPEDIKKDKRKNEYKEIEADLLTHGYKEDNILDFSYKKRLEDLRCHILKFEIFEGLTIEKILSISKIEISIFFESVIDDKTIQRRGKLDIFLEFAGHIFIIDFKKVQDCLSFDKDAEKLKYYRQAAWYSDGIEIITGEKPVFIFLPAEFNDDEIYGVEARPVDDDYIDYGRRENLKSLIKYNEWIKSGSPDIIYPNGLRPLLKPNYLN